MHNPVARARPTAGTNQNALTSTPITAPNVLAAYSAATLRVSPCSGSASVMRSIAGNVAPIAAVAGKSNRKMPENAIAHCARALGCAPVKRTSQALHGAITNTSSRPQSAIISSQPAYQRTGRLLRSMRAPKPSAPSDKPPKNAATTANTAADSWPNHNADCCVHTIW